MQVYVIQPGIRPLCDECHKEVIRYGIQTDRGGTELCPKCFGELLRKAVAVASEMV